MNDFPSEHSGSGEYDRPTSTFNPGAFNPVSFNWQPFRPPHFEPAGVATGVTVG